MAAATNSLKSHYSYSRQVLMVKFTKNQQNQQNQQKQQNQQNQQNQLNQQNKQNHQNQQNWENQQKVRNSAVLSTFLMSFFSGWTPTPRTNGKSRKMQSVLFWGEEIRPFSLLFCTQ